MESEVERDGRVWRLTFVAKDFAKSLADIAGLPIGIFVNTDEAKGVTEGAGDGVLSRTVLANLGR